MNTDLQTAFWNEWNADHREKHLGQVSLEQAEVIISWLDRLHRNDLSLLDVGCGTGWLCSQLTRFGSVTGTDLSDRILARAAARAPEVRFVPGNFLQLDLGSAKFDAVVSLEVLSHVADQALFLEKISKLLKPGGYLMLATQNRPVLQQNNIPAPKPGQLRRWVDRFELQELLQTRFDIEELFSITPQFNRGPLRILNSRKVKRLAEEVGLGGLMVRLKRWQEEAWLGWTLMVLARKRDTSAETSQAT